MSDSKTTTEDEALTRGLEMMDKVYGASAQEMMAGVTEFPYPSETVRNLFANVWARPGLSIRDRRLLVIGATAMLGRADLIETQVIGAILNEELDDQQLEEVALQLAFYTGWGNTQATWRGIQAAKQTVADRKAKAEI